MVALLWDQTCRWAMELEERWNDALRTTTVPFTLLCGYRMPRATGATEPEAWRRFGDSPSDLPGARLVRGTLGERGRHGLVTEASLVVTELAANAVLHARTEFHVSRARRSGDVRIAMHDGSEAP